MAILSTVRATRADRSFFGRKQPPAALSGAGLGWRREISGELLGQSGRDAVDFIEIVAESCFIEKNRPSERSQARLREAQALRELWPVVPHGLNLSLGSADGIDVERARRLGDLARSLRAPFISEHVAFTRGRGGEIGHLTQLPLTRTAVAVLAKNVARARRYFPDVPLLLENPAWTLRWPDDELDEGAFFHEVVRATGCDLLLDISNLYANALNSGRHNDEELRASLHSYPLQCVRMVHLAGGAWRDGFYIDTHAHATPPQVFMLLDELLRVTGPLPILIERDERFPPFENLRDELNQVRALLATAAPRPTDDAKPASISPILPPFSASQAQTLANEQAHLAALLTAATPPASTAPFDAVAVARSRDVLLHKRADEERAQARYQNRPVSTRTI